MNPAMVLGETSKPTSNAKKNTGFKKGDFMADEVLVTYFFQHDYYHQSSLKSNANVRPGRLLAVLMPSGVAPIC
jgi:hypothetical protein